MKPLFDIPVANFNWQNDANNFVDITPDIRSWLLETGSLTQRAIDYCQSRDNDFNVRVLKQENNCPADSEAVLLNMKAEELGLIREVLLNCGSNAIIFARTIIPFSTMSGKHEELNSLGNKPLGEYLFSQSDMTRMPLELSFYENPSNKQQFWARRSVFLLNNNPLLVYEVFLPQLTY